MEKEIGKINKGEYQGTTTDIVVGIKEYNGRVGVDIREFTQSDTYTGPTKKGLRIPADKFEDFKKMINSIQTEDLKADGQAALPEDGKDSDENSGVDQQGLM
jgi:hypothetical protein